MIPRSTVAGAQFVATLVDDSDAAVRCINGELALAHVLYELGPEIVFQHELHKSSVALISPAITV